MKVKHGYALLNRGRIAAAMDGTRFVYAIFPTKKQAQEAQREAPHCTIARVRIEAARIPYERFYLCD